MKYVMKRTVTTAMASPTFFDHTTNLVLLMSASLIGACAGSDAKSEGNDDGTPVAPLVINELQPSNQDTITDENGEADDWIEIFNAGSTAIDMLGFSFADSSGTRQEIPASVVVAPGAFQLFWADDSPSQGAKHLGFKLSAKAGDQVTLRDASGRTLDAVRFGPASGQSTYARFPDGTGSFAWCLAPTPGGANGALCGAP